MGAQAIDLSAGLVPAQSGPVDLSAGLVAKPAPAKEGFFHSLAAQFGLTPEQAQSDSADRAAYPVKSFLKDLAGPAGQILEGFYNQGKVSVGEIKAAHDASVGGNRAAAAVHLVQAVPIVGQAISKAADQAPALTGSYAKDVMNTATDPGTMGTVLGAAINAAPIVAGAVAKVAPTALPAAAAPITTAASRLGNATAGFKAGFGRVAYPQNLSIAPEAANAQALVRALVPDAAAVPNIKSASSVIPDVLASAEKKGMPINGKLDFQKALLDRAQEVQGHYDDLLRQNAGDMNQVPESYDGATNGGNNRATLQQISDRVDDINAELKSNNRKALKSQTTEANAADADLIAEKQKLTDILHNRLGVLTGLQPEDIAGLRQGAGKMRSLAQEVGLSADKDTITGGRAETSGGTTSMKNPLEGVINKAGGGQEVIGNRVLKNALARFTAEENPLPQPIAPTGVATTPEMAQQEFIHSQSLEQAAQDASAARSQMAARGRFSWARQGYDKLITHIQSDPNAGISTSVIGEMANTSEGAKLLVKASDLTPGSAAMKNLVAQIKALGAKK